MYSMYRFFYMQKTAYVMRISDWSSDVCSSDLLINFITCGCKTITITTTNCPHTIFSKDHKCCTNVDQANNVESPLNSDESTICIQKVGLVRRCRIITLVTSYN